MPFTREGKRMLWCLPGSSSKQGAGGGVDLSSFGFIKLKQHLVGAGYTKAEVDACLSKGELLQLAERRSGGVGLFEVEASGKGDTLASDQRKSKKVLTEGLRIRISDDQDKSARIRVINFATTPRGNQ